MAERLALTRDQRHAHSARLKSVLHAARLPVMPSETHIVPVHVGDPEKCKLVSDLLLWKHDIYIQPIIYPTVPRGRERLRIPSSPHHSDELMDHLAAALAKVWDELNLPPQHRSPTMEHVS
jgi:5-aminolevulinate synthase